MGCIISCSGRVQRSNQFNNTSAIILINLNEYVRDNQGRAQARTADQAMSYSKPAKVFFYSYGGGGVGYNLSLEG